MNLHNNSNRSTSVAQNTFFYGWIIVAAATIILTMTSGITFSFGIFFKPLVSDFGWDRASTSGIQSLYFVCYGSFSLIGGWLAERFGPTKVAAISNCVAGLGLVLTSQASTLWQFYVTYGVITGIGVGGNFAVCMSTTARWFLARRGLALGIVSCGAGLGTFVIVPAVGRLIAVFGWSSAYMIMGFAVWIIIISCAMLLRRDPEQMGLRAYGVEAPLLELGTEKKGEIIKDDFDARSVLSTAVRTKVLWTLIASLFLLGFCVQVIMVHLVNYATDIGVAPLVAATMVSAIGISSIVGRLSMGAASDRIGSNNALIICCLVLPISLFWLVFTRQIWMFYIFAIFFGLAYGGEVPQIPSLVAHFFGLKAASSLVGLVFWGTLLGGALGSWVAGKLFDMTQGYQVVFIIAGAAGISSFLLALRLKSELPPQKSVQC